MKYAHIKVFLQIMYILDNMERPDVIQELKTQYPKSKIMFGRLNVTNTKEIEQRFKEIISQIKYIDVLVNGAGIIADRNVELTMAVNLVGLINTTMVAMKHMDKTQGGRGGVIVNIASVLGLEPAHGIAVYTASKHGVIGFTRSMAHEVYYKQTGVMHMAVCPGVTRTTLLEDLEGKDTFDYSRPLSNYLVTCKYQTPAVMGASLVRAVEMVENGGMYICDLGTVRKADPKTHWQFQF